MSDSTSALRRAWPLMLARLVVAAWGISLPMVLARTLVPAEYGTFKQAWLLSSTLFTLLPFGVTSSLLYFLPREPSRPRAYVSHVLAFTWAIGALSGVVLWALAGPVGAAFHNPELERLMPWVALITALRLGGSAWDIVYLGRGEVGRAAGIRAVYETAYTALVVAAAVFGRSLQSIIEAIALVTAARAVVGTGDLLRRFGFEIDRAQLKAQLAYALPFGLAFALVIPQQQFHLYAVSASVPAAAFAIYSVGCLQLPVVEMIYTPISDVMMLAIAEEDGRDRRHLGAVFFRDAVSRLSFVFVPLLALFWVCAPAMIRFLFTDRYAEAVPLFRITILSIPLAALPLEGVMRARAQNRFMLLVSAAKLVASVALVLLGLHFFGLVGALAGFMISEEVGRLLLLVRTVHVLEAPLRQLLPLRDLARRGVAALIAMGAAALGLRAPWPLVLQGIAAGVAFAATYLVVLYALGGLPALGRWRGAAVRAAA